MNNTHWPLSNRPTTSRDHSVNEHQLASQAAQCCWPVVRATFNLNSMSFQSSVHQWWYWWISGDWWWML